MDARSGWPRHAFVAAVLCLSVLLAGCGHSSARYHEDDPDYWRGSLKDSGPASRPAGRVARATKPPRKTGRARVQTARKVPARSLPRTSARATAKSATTVRKPGRTPGPAKKVPGDSPYAPPASPPATAPRTSAPTPVAPDSAAAGPASEPTVAATPPSSSTATATPGTAGPEARPRIALVPPAAAAPPPRVAAPVEGAALCDPDGPLCPVVAALVKDPSRAWLKRPPTRNETLSGVRLQAMRKLATALGCTELDASRDESRAAVTALEEALAEARVAGQPVSRLSRTLLLASDLVTRLGEERLRRCKA